MIRIHKPAPPPLLLQRQATRARATHCALVTRYRAEYVVGKRKIEFKSALYGDPDVKAALFSAQHGKCAFCESKVTHTSYGDVEHFRPKGGWVQRDGDLLARPGYYWLAYDWDNLLFACQLCNSRHKRNLFPLLNPADRVTSHTDAALLQRERPLFIHPGEEDPEPLLCFVEDEPRAVEGPDKPRAHATIVELGLLRSRLNTHRRDALKRSQNMLKVLRAVRKHLRDEELQACARDASQQLAAATRPSGEYASMTRSYLRAQVSPDLRFPIEDDGLLYRYIVLGTPLYPPPEEDPA